MNKERHYTDSLYYELLLTAKYFQMYGTQYFTCQRDLAKLILKDRANTGRLVESLENKGFVKRILVTRNNRPIKQIRLTEAGENILLEITKEIREELKYVHDEVSEGEIEKVCKTLKKLQKVLGKSIITQI